VRDRLVFHLCAVVALAGFFAAGVPLPAQSPGGMSPSVATPGLNVVVHGTSPELNIPDNTWNLGESPVGVDHGGYIDLDLSTPVLHSSTTVGHVHQFIRPGTNTPEGWITQSVTIPASEVTPAYSGTVSRLRGYFRNVELGGRLSTRRPSRSSCPPTTPICGR